MGNFLRPLRTSRKDWLAISIPLFIACWFLRSGKHDDVPVGILWWIFITGDYICSVPEMLIPLVFLTFVFAAVAALVGWILQFFVCMTLDYFRKSKPADAPAAMK